MATAHITDCATLLAAFEAQTTSQHDWSPADAALRALGVEDGSAALVGRKIQFADLARTMRALDKEVARHTGVQGPGQVTRLAIVSAILVLLKAEVTEANSAMFAEGQRMSLTRLVGTLTVLSMVLGDPRPGPASADPAPPPAPPRRRPCLPVRTARRRPSRASSSRSRLRRTTRGSRSWRLR